MQGVTDVWEKYETLERCHRIEGLVEDTKRAFRFYEGDQWYGLSTDESMPTYNFITPTIRYKVSMTAMNQMSITFSSQNETPQRRKLLEQINRLALLWWERLKMDTKCWEIIKESAIAGDSYLFFYNRNGDCQQLDNTNVFLGDERQPNLQRQPYIIIYERRAVEDIQREARQNELADEQIAMILSDAQSEHRVSTDFDAKRDDGMAGSLLYLSVRDGNLYYRRSTRFVEYQPQKCIKGMDIYPIAPLVFNRRKGSARGQGEVTPLIANQIEVNRGLARRIINAKMTAFSRLVYAADKIDNPEVLGEIGTAIEINDATVPDVRNVIGYVTPSAMSPDAKMLTDEMLQNTREMAGAGDAAIGAVDPTKASGVAIIAVRDQAAIPLNEMLASFRQFVEDVALIWYKLWCCYYPAGISLGEDGRIANEALKRLRPLVRVDVSSVSPYSKYAREQAMERLLERGVISFEEYVAALEDDAAAPKNKLVAILQGRQGKEIGEQ